MDVYFQWLVAASAVCVLAGWLGLRAFRRAAAKREAERTQAEAIAWADAQRRAEEKVARHKARSEAAALEAARVAADEAARMEAAVVAAHEAAHAHALKLAAEEAERARRQAEAAHRAALLATQHAADEERARIARAEAELQSRREAERQAAALAPPAPAPAPPPPKPPEQTVVMVADDSKIVRVKTGRLLAQHRYQIVYATDGLEAVQQIEAGMPDVVITDVDMPGMDGFELTRHVRQNPLTAHIPVIMITAADDKHRADADRAGVSVLLGKPYPEEELIAHIRRAMNPAEAKAGALA